MDFADFYEATSHRTLRYAYGLTGDLQQAQDVTQEAYARAWQRWRQVSGYDNAEAWLRLVVNRLVQDWWRHLRVRSRTRLEPPPDVAAPSEDAVVLAAALKQLPKAQSRALALHYLLDLPVAEIAAETGVSDNTVRSWLARGRAGLADRLRDEADAATVPPVHDVTDVGRRRRRTRMAATVTAAGLAVLLVLGIAVAVVRAKRPDHPVTPAPTGTTMRKIGAPVPVDGNLMTLIAGGRAYIAEYRGTTLRMVAQDAQTGRLLWTQTIPRRQGHGTQLTALRDALVVNDMTDALADTARSRITVLDSATGAVRWSYELANNPDTTSGVEDIEAAMFTAPVMMVVNDRTWVIRGLDWRTGQPRWTLSGRGFPLTPVVSRTSGLVNSLFNDFDPATAPPNFYLFEPGGVLREYAAATGRPTGHVWRGLPEDAESRQPLVSRGKLYLTTDTQVSTFDLGGDGPSVGYTAHPVAAGTRLTSRLSQARPCAGDAICVTDCGDRHEEQGINPCLLVLLRPGAAPITQDIADSGAIFAIRDSVYIDQGGIFDSRLRDLKPPELAGAITIGVDDTGRALVYSAPDPHALQELEAMRFWMFDPATRKVTDLGGLTAVPGPLVMGDQRVLIRTAQGMQLFAYAR
jgi:RNA polymerase sigma factor (sigma-70 family)